MPHYLTRRHGGTRGLGTEAHTGKQREHKRTVQPRGRDGRQEELAAVGVLAGVGHGQHTRASVGQLEVLVGKLLAVDALAARAVMASEVCDTEATAIRTTGAESPAAREDQQNMQDQKTSRTLMLARRHTGLPRTRHIVTKPRGTRETRDTPGTRFAAYPSPTRPPTQQPRKTVHSQRTATLAHKLRDHTVEGGALVAKALGASAQLAEVLRRARPANITEADTRKR